MDNQHHNQDPRFDDIFIPDEGGVEVHLGEIEHRQRTTLVR